MRISIPQYYTTESAALPDRTGDAGIKPCGLLWTGSCGRPARDILIIICCTESKRAAIPIMNSLTASTGCWKRNYNEDMREDMAHKGWTINFTNYGKLTEHFGKAGDCIGCGQCESVCPQHLPIIEKLREVSAHFDH